MTSYGFNPTYWFSIDSADDMHVFEAGLATRFLAVDLPRYTAGDSLTVWAMAKVEKNNDGYVNDKAVSTTYELASAANLAIAASACLLMSSSLM
jgi:hypothetical protein